MKMLLLGNCSYIENRPGKHKQKGIDTPHPPRQKNRPLGERSVRNNHRPSGEHERENKLADEQSAVDREREQRPLTLASEKRQSRKRSKPAHWAQKYICSASDDWTHRNAHVNRLDREGVGWGSCGVARMSTSAHRLFMYAICGRHLRFFVDSFKNCPMLSSLSARACGGKVGAGTVEAEEDTCMGGVDLISLLREQTISCRYLDRQGGKEPYEFCAVFSSWLEGCVDRFCRADYVLSGGETEDDSSYSGLSLDILYSRGGSGLLD